MNSRRRIAIVLKRGHGDQLTEGAGRDTFLFDFNFGRPISCSCLSRKSRRSFTRGLPVSCQRWSCAATG